MKNKVRAIPFYEAEITDGFWNERQKLNSKVTIGAVYDRFKETGRFDAFKCDWSEGDETKLRPHFFWDSDVAKWIEGVAYILRSESRPELEKICDDTIDLIIKNQGEDGYFNIYFTVVEPEHRFKDRDKHELYCAGHLMEAAVAYYEATGKRVFLDAMCRYADYIEKRFKILRDTDFITSGHQEIELALFRLYDATGERRYYELAEFFINERGPHDKKLGPTASHAYNQSHAPVREQREAVGHAVRAAYLYAAMAELSKRTDDEALLEACRALFDNISKKKMYVTGGVGSSASGEAYTVDYDLPNILSYSESCAAMGVIFFAKRMLEMEADSKYSDVIERILYNVFLCCTSIDGKAFFYTNPLEVIPYLSYKDNITEYYRIKYPRPSRSEVFKTSCCPSNVVRVVPTLSDLIYGDDGERAYIHQFISSKTKLRRGDREITLSISTDYPKSGNVRVIAEGGDLDVALRIPAFHKSYSGKTEKGYALLTLKDGEPFEICFDMSIRILESNPKVLFDAYKCAVVRGPVVYCSEEIDNGKYLRNLRIDLASPITAEENVPEGYVAPALSAAGYRRSISEDAPIYSEGTFEDERVSLRLIPYHAFANRGECEMQVWIGYKK